MGMVRHNTKHQTPRGKNHKDTSSEPTKEIMALFILRKLIFQTRIRSHPVWLDV